MEFLLLDVEFPRAVHFCVNAARDSMHAISGTPIGMCRHQLEYTFMDVCSELAYADVETLIADGLHIHIPRGFYYWFESCGDETLELLQVEAVDLTQKQNLRLNATERQDPAKQIKIIS